MSIGHNLARVAANITTSVGGLCEVQEEAICSAIETLCETVTTLEQAQAIIQAAKTTLQAAKMQ